MCGVKLLNTFSIPVFTFVNIIIVYVLSFRVITIEKIQYAKYECEAQNKLGKTKGEVTLFETVVPICPPACDGYNYVGGQECLKANYVLLVFTYISIFITRLCIQGQ